jgi:hypothetical protein
MIPILLALVTNCCYMQYFTRNGVTLKKSTNCHWNKDIMSRFDTNSYSISFFSCDGNWEYSLIKTNKLDSSSYLGRHKLRAKLKSSCDIECLDGEESDKSNLKIMDSSIANVISYKPIFNNKTDNLWELLFTIKKDGETKIIIKDDKKKLTFAIPIIIVNGTIKDTAIYIEKNAIKRKVLSFWIPVKNDSLAAKLEP